MKVVLLSQAMFEKEGFCPAILDHVGEGIYVVDRERKIVYWNRAAEAITGFQAAEAIGRSCFDGWLQHVTEKGEPTCHAGCPLSTCMMETRLHQVDLFLLHKAGHRVSVSLRVVPWRDEDGETIGAVEIFRDNTPGINDPEGLEELKRAAMIDPLTGLGNRRFGEMNLDSRLDEFRRYGVRFGLMFMDVDKFKRVNDAFGHDVGDEVLKMAARTLSASLRGHDLVCRWGGEEFIALISHISAEHQLLAAAQKLLALVNRSSISSPTDIIHVTISIGATMATPDDDRDSLLKRADQLMYQVKQRGGNNVCVESFCETVDANNRF